MVGIEIGGITIRPEASEIELCANLRRFVIERDFFHALVCIEMLNGKGTSDCLNTLLGVKQDCENIGSDNAKNLARRIVNAFDQIVLRSIDKPEEEQKILQILSELIVTSEKCGGLTGATIVIEEAEKHPERYSVPSVITLINFGEQLFDGYAAVLDAPIVDVGPVAFDAIRNAAEPLRVLSERAAKAAFAILCARELFSEDDSVLTFGNTGMARTIQRYLESGMIPQALKEMRLACETNFIRLTQTDAEKVFVMMRRAPEKHVFTRVQLQEKR